jgi:CHAT domain-containing protein/Tfp pilus assembly protein PilF
MHTKDTATLIAPTLICLYLLALTVHPASGQEKPSLDVRHLPVGGTVERQLTEGERHVYTVKLKRGGSLRLDLTEKGVNCLLAVVSKHKPEKSGVNFEGGFGRETITFIAKDSGEHFIFIIAPINEYEAIAHIVTGHKLPAGAYSLTVAINPAAGQADKQRAQAVQSLAEGGQLVSARGAASAGASIPKFEAALRLWQELKEDYWIGYTANLLAKSYFGSGQPQKAVEILQTALELARKTNDKQALVTANSNLGSLYSLLGRHTEALKFYSEALRLSEGSEDEGERAELLTLTGMEYMELGSTQAAIEHFQRALPIRKRFKDFSVASRIQASLGLLYARGGEMDKALSNLNEALELARLIDNRNLEASVLNDIADCYSQIGEFQQALEYGWQSLGIFLRTDNRRGQAKVYANLGEYYLALGELQEAQTHFQRAVEIFKSVSDDRGTADALRDLANAYRAAGDTQRAEQILHDALGFLKGKESENPQLHADFLLDEADSLRCRGDAKAAYATYFEAIKIARAIRFRNYEARALLGLAELAAEKRDYQKVMVTFTQALFAAASYNDPEMEAWTLERLMRSWGLLGNQPLAILYGKESVNKYQALRMHIRRLDAAMQKSFAHKAADAYLGLAYVLLHQQRYAEALQVINTFQDQQFYDFDRDPKTPARPLTLTPREAAFSASFWQMLEQGVTMDRRLEELKGQAGEDPSPEQTQEIARLTEQFEKAEQEFGHAIEKAAADFSKPPREGGAGSGVEDIKEMQTILRELSAATAQKTVAIYTLVGAGGVAALLITPDSVTAAPLVADDHFDEKVLQYYAVLQTPDLDPRPLGKELYDLIVKPLEPELREAGAQTILWSQGGTLRYVPMASLWDGEKYLVERFQHVVFTRADRERMTRAVGRDWTGVGFGSSRAQSVAPLGYGSKVPFSALPGVPEELGAIFRMAETGGGVVRGQIFADDRFTKNAFLNVLKQRHPLIHIASHFSFRPGDDTQSFLLLGDGTALTLNEMKRQGQLFQGVELLTLSACDTAATRPDAMGREIDGFAESAQRLGAGAVMATLWTVADDSTPQLMREFYRARQSALLTKAEALRMAQLALLSGESRVVAPTRGRAGVPAPVKVELVDTLDGNTRRASRASGRGAEIVYVERAKAPAFNTDRDRPFAHPYYWAPFILIGNGR